MRTVFALLCFVVVIHWLIFPYPSGLLHWHCGNLTIAPVPAKLPWCIWINASCEFIKNDCITTTKQSTTKPCAYFLGYTVQLFVDDIKSFHGHTSSGYTRVLFHPHLNLIGLRYIRFVRNTSYHQLTFNYFSTADWLMFRLLTSANLLMVNVISIDLTIGVAKR